MTVNICKGWGWAPVMGQVWNSRPKMNWKLDRKGFSAIKDSLFGFDFIFLGLENIAMINNGLGPSGRQNLFSAVK
jgi:hypothetical protein